MIFGYGVNPRRLWGFWWFIVCLFALLYWTGGGINDSTSTQPLNILDYLWFSITVAVTPGFAGYKPTPGIFQIVAGLEAIFGTFMWAAFITTFAKKYMR
ncbi:MAG: ion channel [Methanothrix sp.]